MCTLVLLVWLAAPPAEESPAKKVYAARCAACHGPTGKGDTAAGQKLNAGDMSSAAWHAARPDDAVLAQAITDGKRRDDKLVMPGAKDLAPSQVQALVQLVRRFKSAAAQSP